MQIHSDHRIIELNPSAAFQLLVFADSEPVRDAAALALQPLITANPLLVECNTGAFDGLPRWEQTAALLIASLIERDPLEAQALGVAAPGLSLKTRVFRYAFAAAREVNDLGLEQVSWTRATFALPRRQAAVFTRLAQRSTQTLDPNKVPGKGWNVDQAAVWLQLPDKLPTRATRWSKPSLVSPTGRLHGVVECDGASVIEQRMLPLDSSLLLRLESGALRGFQFTLVHRNRIVRADRAQDVVLSIEIGASIDDPPVVSLHRGELAPRFDPGLLDHVGTIALPLLGGATLAELDRIARRTGVWHGSFLRGSFAYHPLRAVVSESHGFARGVA